MCGIAGLILAPEDTGNLDLGWLEDLSGTLAAIPVGAAGASAIATTIDTLRERFDELTSFRVHRAVVEDPLFASRLARLAENLARHEQALLALSREGRTDLDPLVEGLRDYAWQVREEVIGFATRVDRLLPEGVGTGGRLVAFAIEHVVSAIDRLEVRGRDSAGIVVQTSLRAFSREDLSDVLRRELDGRLGEIHARHGAVSLARAEDGTVVVGFVYKTANLIGRLGDNGAALRQAIAADRLLWALAEKSVRVDVLAHTRWASSGVISMENCHPHNASLLGDTPQTQGLGAMFVLNGDIDNHHALERDLLGEGNWSIAPQITTDTKIIPISCRFVAKNNDPFARLGEALPHLEGSMAIAGLDPVHPGNVVLAQKGSGQGLYAARLAEGWMFASEVYGLATLAREAYNLAASSPAGCVARLTSRSDAPEVRDAATGENLAGRPGTIQIFSRDIYRGRFDFFFEKEIHDAPESIEKTLRGRYRRLEGSVRFDGLANDIWAALRMRTRSGFSGVFVIGQGTAGVAGVGIAHLVERALSGGDGTSVPVRAMRASEFSAGIDALDLADALVIAVSQSGTTTDTNRAVDLARARGAFVHAIVNRRNSDLVHKADSVLYTSDGRDIEMSVASTKAFYAQLAAGKLTALFLGDAMGTSSEETLVRGIADLERLSDLVREVLEGEEVIAEAARALAPRARYWAVTGSGANHVAALEIRIKLSELCYKSIPVDFTEDKKHIDLSTEPLTLVIANDLEPSTLSDVAKEVAIFKAHNGRPIVFATEGQAAEAFARHAERVIALPAIGSDLAFVLAAVAGHLFGFHAARAIDAGALPVKEVVRDLGAFVATGERHHVRAALALLDDIVARAADGAYDSGLAARDIARLARTARRIGTALAGEDLSAALALARDSLEIVRQVYEETSRPIDTIRHQAKTVTVGTSRPDDLLDARLREAIARVGIEDERIASDDRRTLAGLARLVERVETACLLVADGSGWFKLAAQSGAIPSSLSRYRAPSALAGVFASAFEERRVRLARIEGVPSIVVPLYGLHAPGALDGFVCLTVACVERASREHKIVALNAIGRFKDILRAFEDADYASSRVRLGEELARHAPEAILFDAPLLELRMP